MISMARDGFNDQIKEGHAFLLTPIPEPETYAMLLAGLGLMATVTSRRRKTAGAEASF
jgi:hypothetical protein